MSSEATLGRDRGAARPDRQRRLAGAHGAPGVLGARHGTAADRRADQRRSARSQMGLVNRVVPPGEVLATALDLARRISLGAPVALEKTKEVMVRTSGLPLADAFRIETAVHEGKRRHGRRQGRAARVHGKASAGVSRKGTPMKLLEGIRVVEMGLWVAGPAAGGILADWGAEVIKLGNAERRPDAQAVRRAVAARRRNAARRSTCTTAARRASRSTSTSPTGWRWCERLLATADVFITNMRPQYPGARRPRPRPPCWRSIRAWSTPA